MADVAMPRLSDSMEEGTILKWLKSDGDEVKRGEELVEIETDKANMTYEADQDGVLRIVASEGDTLPVGDTIASIGGGAEPQAQAEPEEPEAEEEDSEPWPGYDKATAAQIKQVLTDAKDDDEAPLTAEQVEYVLDYERNREKPPPRKRVIDFCEALLEEFANGGEAEEEPEEEAPKRGRGRGRSRSRKAEQSEGKPAAPPESSNGVIVLTREQILTALTDGEVEIAV